MTNLQALDSSVFTVKSLKAIWFLLWILIVLITPATSMVNESEYILSFFSSSRQTLIFEVYYYQNDRLFSYIRKQDDRVILGLELTCCWTPCIIEYVEELQSLISVVDYHILNIEGDVEAGLLTFSHTCENCQGATILIVRVSNRKLLLNFELRIRGLEFRPLEHSIRLSYLRLS